MHCFIVAVINNYFEKLPQIHSCLCELVPVDLRCVWEWGRVVARLGQWGLCNSLGSLGLSQEKELSGFSRLV